MSLLGNNVYANPTTPLWGGGGGGGGSNLIVPSGGQITFQGTPDQVLKLDGGNITALDASGNLATTSAGEFRAYDTVGSYVGFGSTPALGLGIRSFIDDGSLQNTFATFGSGGWDLSNVSSINGVPYFNSPGTQFDYRNYPGGSPLVEAPDWGVLNAISFTAPVNGKVYVESLGTYVALVAGGGVSMTFAVDGTNVSETATTINAYAGNTNLFGTSMFQFAVSANVTYDISSIAHCSAIPPADPDVVVTSSRMFLLFSPN